eukprot:m.269235 g.269235  ORF g.269235 m.269235 type:complete len:254 (+) comp36764_c0_seq1:3-764(+)
MAMAMAMGAPCTVQDAAARSSIPALKLAAWMAPIMAPIVAPGQSAPPAQAGTPQRPPSPPRPAPSGTPSGAPAPPVIPPPLPAGQRYHAFLSHAWGPDAHGRDNHGTVVAISEALERRGFAIWVDKTCMHGEIHNDMADGVRDSAAIVCCITGAWLDKVGSRDIAQNCRSEYYLALQSKSHALLAVPMETDTLDPKQWPVISGSLGTRLYKARFDPGQVPLLAPHQPAFEQQVDQLAEHIIAVCTRAASAAMP